MKLLQFTDIHLTAPGKTIGGRDPIKNFELAIEHALKLHHDAEAVFITGDLSDWGEAEDYKLLRQLLDRFLMPVHLCIGNHDDRPTFTKEFPELEGDSGFIQHAISLSNGTALTLDTWGPESHAGHFCEQRAAWLGNQLNELDGPIYLFMHHNPVPIEVAPMDEIMLLDHQRFAQTIKPYAQKIAHIFHGHCHMHLSGSLHGIPFSAPRGTNHAGWPDFAATQLLSAADLTESYSVIFAKPDRTMVHMIEYGYKGEIRGEGSPDYAAWDKLTMVR